VLGNGLKRFAKALRPRQLTLRTNVTPATLTLPALPTTFMCAARRYTPLAASRLWHWQITVQMPWLARQPLDLVRQAHRSGVGVVAHTVFVPRGGNT